MSEITKPIILDETGQAGVQALLEIVKILTGSSVTIKGADGKDGQDGQDGADGFSPTVSITAITGGNRITITDKSGTKTIDVLNGKDGTNGQDGKDGTSVTHSWNGTTLTVTSASGTSSADLKGADGKTGAAGKSAYQYAKDGGYTGTEAEFAQTMVEGYIPEAVSAGAMTLVDKALSREGALIFRFPAVSDAHHKSTDYLGEEIAAGTKELGQAVGEVLKLISVDFVANLGDSAWGTAYEESKEFNRLFLDKVRGQTQIWTEGNHETDILTAMQIQGLIYANNKGLVQDADHWLEGYGYMDFPNQKVRVICLNTNQGASGNVSGMSNAQLKWLAETALNMSGKTDWNVITMGHHPISYNTTSLCNYAAKIVEAFIKESSLDLKDGSNAQITNVNFSGKNCQYVAHFHGHAHAYSVVRMQKYTGTANGVSTYAELDAWEICIPNACYTRNNQYLNNGQYTERYSTAESYNKTDVDGNRTAFNLVTVCLDDKIIYADNYGAGIDRVVSYNFEKASYTITRNLTNCTSSSSALSVVEGTAHTETLTAADGYTMDGAAITVTMGGVDVSSSYADGTLNIASVTGNVVITASAVSTAPAYTNKIPISTDTDGSIYGGDYNGDGVADGYKTSTRIGSSGSVTTKDGMCTTGLIPVAKGDVIRLKNITLTGPSTSYIVWYANGVFATVSQTSVFEGPDDNGVYSYTSPHPSNNAFRLSVGVIDETSIVTVNEPIE